MNVFLESFNFKIATLIQDGPQWRVQRRKGRARRFVEQLAPDIPLEMVAIPRGRFIMGSPESEAGHYSQELPQHEVTLKPFSMGRYPITQDQWRVVASSLPQIERELDPKPSAGKGKIRPVETVSWDDAVEFCARLSVHTGREYRLPTSAEWLLEWHSKELPLCVLPCLQHSLPFLFHWLSSLLFSLQVKLSSLLGLARLHKLCAIAMLLQLWAISHLVSRKTAIASPW